MTFRMRECCTFVVVGIVEQTMPRHMVRDMHRPTVCEGQMRIFIGSGHIA